MKRLFVLSAVVILTVSSVGCRQSCLSGLWPWRSNECDPCMTAEPACCGDTYMTPPPMISGPAGTMPITPGPVVTMPGGN